MSEDMLLDVVNGVATLTLNRPARLNALTPAMIEAIEQALRRCEADPAVAAIIVTGAGRGFCSGLDLAALADTIGKPLPPPPTHRRPGLFTWLPDISKPIIAAVNGAAVGGGFILAMMADLRFASTTATFNTMFARRGLVAEHGISHILPRQIGLSRALDLILSARTIDAEEAQRIGFVDRLCAPDALLDEARAYAALLATGVSPLSMAAIKMQVYADLNQDLDAACRAADRLVRATLGHADQHESLIAGREKRPPRFRPWQGRGFEGQGEVPE
ncbi:enoyl-CoA hydratase [Sphingobium jiangsuense]|uniref:Enoyl-CoA hydratase/carnithine racemase n=1 Tax=Sphingobium jiangsuense TaxID=870476 RepID=A0A7W6BPZ2_9SPHN|nr:enoyl-CoA hydratase-related protein [Sphingobium jiangsuense]MBB3925734.1 enoyl-CoA hydratase/carnithine racemase [Sphingobium jiangsuense]GLT00002.1 enoyl-CoA hydratase [Sphingobium jiangsuense]